MRRTGTTAAAMPPSGGCRRLLRPCAAHALVLAFAAVILCCVPYGAHLECNPGNPFGVRIAKSEAEALQVYNPQALPFLQACASAAGMSVKDYMLTCGIVIGGFTGLNIFGEDVSYGADQTTNVVAKLVSTAEWPAWEELTAEQQQSYGGNSDNYYAQQFNALAGCLGLADSRNVYYSSGGGDLDSDGVSIAERIGEVGEKYATGAILHTSELYNLLTHPEQLFNNSGYNNFGLRVTKTVNIDEASFRFMIANPNLPGYQYRYPIDGTNWFNFKQHVNMSPGDYTWVFVGVWTTPLPKIELTAGYGMFNYENVSSSNQWEGMNTGGNMERHASSGNRFRGYYDPANDYLNECWGGGWTVGGTDIDTDDVNYDQQMPGTPTGLYGPGGVDNEKDPPGIGSKNMGPTTTYPDITGEPREGEDPPYVPPTPSERPENPYNPTDPENPGYQSGTPEWKETTTENLTPLLNVRLDKLFPFCLLYDLNTLWGKVQGLMQQNGLTGQDYEDYLHIRFPIEIVSSDLGIYINEEIEFDLTPVHDLLLMTKTAVFVLLIFMTLLSLIRFWQRILTGG